MYLEYSLPTLIESVTLEVSSGQIEEYLCVVEVVELTKTVLILGNENTRNEEQGMGKSELRR